PILADRCHPPRPNSSHFRLPPALSPGRTGTQPDPMIEEPLMDTETTRTRNTLTQAGWPSPPAESLAESHCAEMPIRYAIWCRHSDIELPSISAGPHAGGHGA